MQIKGYSDVKKDIAAYRSALAVYRQADLVRIQRVVEKAEKEFYKKIAETDTTISSLIREICDKIFSKDYNCGFSKLWDMIQKATDDYTNDLKAYDKKLGINQAELKKAKDEFSKEKSNYESQVSTNRIEVTRSVSSFLRSQRLHGKTTAKLEDNNALSSLIEKSSVLEKEHSEKTTYFNRQIPAYEREIKEIHQKITDTKNRLSSVANAIEKKRVLDKKILDVGSDKKIGNLLNYMSSEDAKYVSKFSQALSVLDILPSKVSDTNYLIQIVAIAGKHPKISYKAIELDNQFSIVCRELYEELFRGNTCEACEGFENYKTSFNFQNDSVSVHTPLCYDFIKEEYIEKIESFFESHPKANIVDCAIALNPSEKRLKDLKSLYEETPEQILITEQRYYKAKEIEQLEENAWLERQEIERQARLERDAIARQTAALERQAELDRRQAARDAELGRQQAARDAELARRQASDLERQRAREQASARRTALLRCENCQNWSACGLSRGNPNCGSFVPKRH